MDKIEAAPEDLAQRLVETVGQSIFTHSERVRRKSGLHFAGARLTDGSPGSRGVPRCGIGIAVHGYFASHAPPSGAVPNITQARP